MGVVDGLQVNIPVPIINRYELGWDKICTFKRLIDLTSKRRVSSGRKIHQGDGES